MDTVEDELGAAGSQCDVAAAVVGKVSSAQRNAMRRSTANARTVQVSTLKARLQVCSTELVSAQAEIIHLQKLLINGGDAALGTSGKITTSDVYTQTDPVEVTVGTALLSDFKLQQVCCDKNSWDPCLDADKVSEVRDEWLEQVGFRPTVGEEGGHEADVSFDTTYVDMAQDDSGLESAWSEEEHSADIADKVDEESSESSGEDGDFTEGQTVEYYSLTVKDWIETIFFKVNDTGTYRLECKRRANPELCRALRKR